MSTAHRPGSAIRLTVVMTHPVQYLAPWFRQIQAEVPEIELTVLYATEPTSRQQGTGFGAEFHWDVPLTEGYRCRVLRPAGEGVELSSASFHGVDLPEVGEAILETAPDAVLVPGWHSATLVRALAACRHYRIPAIYRGDNHLGMASAAGAGALRAALWRWRNRRRLARFDAWLAVGSRARAYLEALTPRPHRPGAERSIFDAPHAVDNDFFAQAAAVYQAPEARGTARRELGVAGTGAVFLFAGKLSPIKRPLDLLRGLARLAAQVPESLAPKLIVAGGGELEADCRAESERLGLRVSWAGFFNQSQLGRAYAAADCLVLPSASESWGLVVNEAMATGLPAVLSDGVGCAPDLVEPGLTGEIYPAGDVAALAEALARVTNYLRDPDTAAACRDQVARCSYRAASAGLLAACRAVAPPVLSEGGAEAIGLSGVRLLVPCGGMVVVGGLERQTFELLRTLREAGAAVHCLLNDWENHRIVPLAEAIGASWRAISYRGSLDRHARNPLVLARLGWELLRTDRAVRREARRFGATHVLVPELGALLRSPVALRGLRRCGVPVLMRVGNAPERGRFYRRLWSRVVPPRVDLCVANSRFGLIRLRQEGIPPAKTALIHNRVARRDDEASIDDELAVLLARRPTLLTVGQVAPFKGTDLAVEATLALAARGHDVQAVIVGRRPEWPPEYVRYLESIERRAAHAAEEDPALAGRVHFTGEREAVAAILRRATLLVAPIVQEETFGNVVLEAAQAGLPAVVFPRGGLPELVEEGVTGWICPRPDLEALIDTLERALADPLALRRAGERARERVESPDSPYAAERYARAWRRLFDCARLGTIRR